MLLYGMLAVCAVGAGLLVCRYDLYDREPWWALAVAFVLGAFTMAEVGPVEAVAFELWPGAMRESGLALVAAVVEEGTKLVLVAFLALVLRRHFNDPMDGVVYGSVVGLGMAVEESVAVLGLPTCEPVPYPPELVRLCGHLVMGGIGGYGVGLARTGARRWPAAVAGAFAVAAGLHFLWDWVALWPAPPALDGWKAASAAGVMVGGLGLYGSVVHAGSVRSRRHFGAGGRGGLWGWPFRARGGGIS